MMSEYEKLTKLLENSNMENQNQGLALFAALGFDIQLKVGFDALLFSRFESIRKEGYSLLNTLSESNKKSCLDKLFSLVRIADDGTPESPNGWFWNTEMLDLFLQEKGAELRGLRLSTLCRSDEGFGDLSWLRHCPQLTHIDLDTIHITKEGVQNLVQSSTLQHIELALCSLKPKEIEILQSKKPHGTIRTNEDKVCYVFQYDKDGRGIRIASALYPQFRNGALIGVFASTHGYAGGGSQGNWNGAAIITDEHIHWVWNNYADMPKYCEQIYCGEGGESNTEILNPVNFNGYIQVCGAEDEVEEYSTTYALNELCSLIYTHIEWNEDMELDDLVPDTREKVIAAGGFFCSTATCTPGLLLAGISGSLLTSWPTTSIHLPLARRSIAPGLPSFTKDGVVPKYRMIVTLWVEYSGNDGSSKKGWDEASAERSQLLRPLLEEMGLKYISTQPDDQYNENLILLMESPQSMVELDRQFLALSNTGQLTMTVYDLESLVSQIYDFGDYDTGAIGLCTENIQYYVDAAKSMKDKYQSLFPNATA
jgi:hypothetical protein